MITTQSIVEKILYLSLYDPRYRQIPEQDKLTIYQIICDEFNVAAEIEGKNLITPYNYSFTDLTSGVGYSIIDTTIGGTTPGLLGVDNVTFNYTNQIRPLSYTDNSTFQSNVALTNVPGFPSMWSWYLPTKSIWIYPAPVISGQFLVLGRPALPTISVTYDPGTNLYTFSPTDIDYDREINFIKYLTFYTAKEVCFYFNAVFSENKERNLETLRKQLINNREANFSLKTSPAQLTKGQPGKNWVFPWFFYASGGR